MKRFIRHILPPVAAGAVLGALTVWFLLSRTLALGLIGRRAETPVPPSGEVWTLETADGLTLRACAGEAGEGKNWVLLLHGLEGSAGELEDLARAYRGRGWSTLIPDLRGSGASGGQYRDLGPGEREDVLAWMERIRVREPGCRIVLHGVGVGANAALWASGERPEGLLAVVADSVLPDLWALGERQLTERFQGRHLLTEWGASVFTRLCIGYDWASLTLRRQTAGTRAPILFLHGEGDDLVPADMAASLCRCAPKGSRLQLLPCGRGEGFLRERESYLDAVFAFLTGCSGWSQTR